MLTDRNYREFSLAYTFQYEKMMYKFWGRLDKLCSFALLFFGAAVSTELFPPVLLGLAVAVLSGIQLVYEPAKKSLQARQRFVALVPKVLNLSNLSDQELDAALAADDSDAIGMLAHPARLAALLQLGRPTEQERALEWYERLAAHFVGEVPVLPPRQ